MSRMLAHFGASARTLVEAVGPSTADQFAELSAVHSDGWGTAWIDAADHSLHARGEIVAFDRDQGLGHAVPEPTLARLVYLRFASRGAPVTAANVQPFLRRDVAFQHNGALAPRTRVLQRLTTAGRAALRGTTDSEAYFQLAIEAGESVSCGRAAMEGGPIDSAAFVAGLTAAARAMRADFPAACLNAFALTPDALVVVHSAGTVPPPLSAFAARDIDLAAHPPGLATRQPALVRPVGRRCDREHVRCSDRRHEAVDPDSITVFTRGRAGVQAYSESRSRADLCAREHIHFEQ